MDSIVFQLYLQLAGQAPVLLVYLVGMILAVVFWRRCPGPSALTLAATALLLVTALVQTLLVLYLTRARMELGWSNATYAAVWSANALAGSVIRAVALGLLLAAVFLGRKGVPRPWPDEAPQPSGPTSGPPEERGITSRPGG
jgi:hypothetical protein